MMSRTFLLVPGNRVERYELGTGDGGGRGGGFRFGKGKNFRHEEYRYKEKKKKKIIPVKSYICFQLSYQTL